MKVKCISNTGKNIPQDFYVLGGYNKDMVFAELTIGNIYVVYAIFTLYKHKCFLICNDCYDGFSYTNPMFYPADLFEIIDTNPSKYWINRSEKYNDEDDMNDVGFPDILNNEFFLGGTIEGYANEVSIFKYYKNAIDMENR